MAAAAVVVVTAVATVAAKAAAVAVALAAVAAATAAASVADLHPTRQEPADAGSFLSEVFAIVLWFCGSPTLLGDG